MKADYVVCVDNEQVVIERSSKNMTDNVVDQLIARRKILKMTQQDIANATGIKRANIARIELKKTEASLDSLIRIAGAMGMILNITLDEKE